MRWRVDVHPKGQKEIAALSLKMKAKLKHVRHLLEEYGPLAFREPYIKYLRDKLWEIRLQDQDGIARVLYILANNKRIVFLHAFVKKTEKTPQGAFEKALQRINEVDNG